MIQRVWDRERLRDRLQLRAIELRRPLSCTMELTYRCNFRCRMCYIRMTDAQAAPFGRLRTAEEWLDMARQLRDAGVLYLTLTGGECTLYPGFETLYEQLSRMGFLISVMSNAGAYTEGIREVFRRFPPSSVSVTLYGGSSRTYEAVTGAPRGFDNAVENIRFFQSLGVPVALNFTVIRQNAPDYPLVGALCRELGISYTLNADITAHRHDPSFSDALTCRLPPEERAFLACYPPDQVSLALEDARNEARELQDLRPPEAPAAPPSEPDSCVGSFTGCAIAWNGDMQSCVSMLGHRSVRPFDIGFEAAWALLKARHPETFRLPAACQFCTMAQDCVHNCPGRRFEGSGSPLERDPEICRYVWLLQRCRARRAVSNIPPVPPCA